jgi:hypothetical protein
VIANTKQWTFIPFSIPEPLWHVTYIQFWITKYDTRITLISRSPIQTRELHPFPHHQVRHMTYIQFRITKYDMWYTSNSRSSNTTRELHPVPHHQIQQFNHIHIRINKHNTWLTSSSNNQNTNMTCINYKSPLYRIVSYKFCIVIFPLV